MRNKYKTLLLCYLLFAVPLTLWAADPGLQDSTASGDIPNVQTGPPAAPVSVPGPMDDETNMPVTKSEQKLDPATQSNSTTDSLEAQISKLQKKLSNPNLSKSRRNALEKQLTRLEVKKAVAKP